MGRRRLVALGAAAVLVLAVLVSGMGSAIADFTVYKTTNSDYASKVDFAVKCSVTRTAPDDPIVKFGQPGASHSHTFSGNAAVGASSTEFTLAKNASGTCKMLRDRAAYWMPSLYDDGALVTPYETRAYYRAGTYAGTALKPIPFGLKMVAGDAMAMSPQKATVAGWQCRNASGNSLAKQSAIPVCAVGDFLEASVVFPNCWDGVHLDSADHKSHMSYAAATAACDSGHPVRLPQLTFAQRYPVDSTRGAVTLATMMDPSMDSRLTLHADFLNAWDPAAFKYLLERCIYKGIACEDVSEKRLPPGAVLPPSAWPAGP